MRFLDQLLARMGVVTGRRPHNPALDKELHDLWHDPVVPNPFDGTEIIPMRPGEIIDQAYARVGAAERLSRGTLAPSGQNDDLPAEHDGRWVLDVFKPLPESELEVLRQFWPFSERDGEPLQAAAHPAGDPVAEEADFSPGEPVGPYEWWSVDSLISMAERQHRRMHFGPYVRPVGSKGL